jgi:integrase
MVEEINDRGTPHAAHQALIYARRLFNWAIARDTYGLMISPCDRVSARDLIGPLSPRQRTLSDAELRFIWRATDAADYPLSPFIRMLLQTGQRRSEVAEATWDEFDLEKKLWTIPASRMKNGIAHAVPLAASVLDILSSLPRFKGPYLFSTTFGERPISGFAKLKRRLDQRIAELTPEAVVRWRLHDLRRTMRTHLSALEIAPIVAELVIGHRQRGIQRVYDLHSYEKEKLHALELWTNTLLAIVEPLPPNVITFSRRI